MSAREAPVLRRAVALGGGHGQARTLRALREVAEHVTAIATVADDGGSSGRLRRGLGVLPPGDLRMAFTALAPTPALAALLDYRFADGDLAGHTVGNIVMVALADLEDGFVAGLDRLAALLGIPHRVLPCTTADVQLAAEGPDGTIVGQATIAATPGVDELRLVGEEPVATPDAVAAIEAADLVVLGPGSVCTSILPNLLVPGVADALVRTTAPRVFVANLDEQRGEGEGRSIADHVRLLTNAAPGLILDHVLVHDGPVPPAGRPALRADDELAMLVGRVRAYDFLGDGSGHDADVLAGALRDLVA